MCLFSLMLIRCAICFSVNCFGIHIAGFPLFPKQRGTGRGPGDREWDQQGDTDLTDIWKLFQVFVFSDWNFLWKLYWEVVLWTQASCFSFMKMWFLSSPLFLSAAHSTWSCWDPHSQWVSVVGGADTPVQRPEGAAIVSNYHIAATLGWSREKSSLLQLLLCLVNLCHISEPPVSASEKCE